MAARGRALVAVAAVLGLAGGAGAGSAAGQLTLTGVGTEQTIRCDERDVVVNGANQRLTLRGRCALVIVHGADNVVRVERLGRAEVDGLGNRVEWELALRGERPEVELRGVNNTSLQVRAASAPPAAPAASARTSLRITSTDAQQSYDCAGGSATVEGSDNRLTLTDCAELIVTGAENYIVLRGPVRHIQLLGGENEVRWSEGEGGRPPKVELMGADNRVFQIK